MAYARLHKASQSFTILRRVSGEIETLCAGKDLHKLSLPTHVNEPLTDLQRRAEAFEASELLDQVPPAACQTNPS